MKRAYRFILCVAVLIAAVSGCVQPVEIEPPADRDVFVKCILMNDTVQTVTLLYSGAIGAERFEPVEEAEVYVEATGNIKYRFSPKGNGVWESIDFQPLAGFSYTLHILIPGRNPILATTCFPDKFSIIPRRNAPIRWVADTRAVYEQVLPGTEDPRVNYMYLLPQWVNAFRQYIVAAGVWAPFAPASVDFDVLDRIAEYGGTTLQQAMPGMVFRMESKSKVFLYILGTCTDEQGVVSRIRSLGTNHRDVDHGNLIPVAFRSGIAPDEASAPLFIDPEYSGYQALIPQNRQTYDKAILSTYDGQPLFAEYLRIVTGGSYDNGLKLYSIVQEENDSLVDSSATVTPPYAPPAGNEDLFNVPYCLRFAKDGQSFFTVYGDFYYNIWGENETVAHPSLYFCSLSQEYDQYLRSLKSIQDEQGDILTTLYEDDRHKAYTNISGGYGVFGAAYVLRHDCDARYEPRVVFGSTTPEIGYVDYPAYPASLPEL